MLLHVIVFYMFFNSKMNCVGESNGFIIWVMVIRILLKVIFNEINE